MGGKAEIEGSQKRGRKEKKGEVESANASPFSGGRSALGKNRGGGTAKSKRQRRRTGGKNTFFLVIEKSKNKKIRQQNIGFRSNHKKMTRPSGLYCTWESGLNNEKLKVQTPHRSSADAGTAFSIHSIRSVVHPWCLRGPE